jgi:hypothetical protein
VNESKEVAPWTARVREDCAEHRVDRNGCVDCVATGGQNIDTGL